jgi:hypothetical protein
MAAPKINVHIHLKVQSDMRDSYGSHHTVGRAAIELDITESVERLKFLALAALGEFSELRDVHHTACKFVVGTKFLSAADDSKLVSEVGVSDNAELHVLLPFGHDSVLAQPANAAAAAAASPASPASPKHKIHVALKSEIRDSYDGVVTAGRSEVDVDPNDTIERFKALCFGALGEIEEIADVHHTHCSFHVEGGGILRSDDDGKRVKDFPEIKNGAKVDIMLPLGKK